MPKSNDTYWMDQASNGVTQSCDRLASSVRRYGKVRRGAPSAVQLAALQAICDSLGAWWDEWQQSVRTNERYQAAMDRGESGDAFWAEEDARRDGTPSPQQAPSPVATVESLRAAIAAKTGRQ